MHGRGIDTACAVRMHGCGTAGEIAACRLRERSTASAACRLRERRIAVIPPAGEFDINIYLENR